MRRTLLARCTLALAAPVTATADDAAKPIKLLIITGDNAGPTTGRPPPRRSQDFLSERGRINVDVTTTPAKDLTDENLAKYDVLLLNYQDTAQGGAEDRSGPTPTRRRS